MADIEKKKRRTSPRQGRFTIEKEEKSDNSILNLEGEEYQEVNEKMRYISPGEKRYVRQPDNNRQKYAYFGHYAVLGMCSGVDLLHVVREKVTAGYEYTAPGSRLTFGRNGCSIAKAMRDIGMDATLYGFCGGENGEIMRMHLDKANMAYRLAKVKDETCMGSLIVDDNGVETHVQSTAFYVTVGEQRALIRQIAEIDPAPKFLVISGQQPDSMENFVYRDILKFFRRKGCKIFLDCQGAPLRLAIKERPEYVFVNKGVLEDRYGEEMDTLGKLLFGTRKYRNDSLCEIICDAGEDGYIYCGKDLYALVTPAKYITNEHSKKNAAENIDFEHVNPSRRHGQFIASFLWGIEFWGNTEDALKLAAAMSRAALACKFDDTPITEKDRRMALERTSIKIY